MISNVLIIYNGIPVWDWQEEESSAMTVLTSGFIEALVNFSYEIDTKGLTDFNFGSDKFYKILKEGRYLVSIQSNDPYFGPSEFKLMHTISNAIKNVEPLRIGVFTTEVNEIVEEILVRYSNQVEEMAQKTLHIGIVSHGTSMQLLYQYPTPMNTADYLSLQKDMGDFVQLESKNVKDYGLIHLKSSNSLLYYIRLGRIKETGLYLFLPSDYMDFETNYFIMHELNNHARRLFINITAAMSEDINTYVTYNRDDIDMAIIRWVSLIENMNIIHQTPVPTNLPVELVKSFTSCYSRLMEAIISLDQIQIIADSNDLDALKLIVNYVFPGVLVTTDKRLASQIYITSDSSNMDERILFYLNAPQVKDTHNYITKRYLAHLPDPTLEDLQDVSISVFTWFISKIYTYLLLNPIERLNIESLFSPEDKIAVPAVVRAINRLKPSIKDQLGENIHLELSLKQLYGRFTIRSPIKLKNPDDEAFLVSYFTALPGLYRFKTHSFIISLPSGDRCLSVYWTDDNQSRSLLSITFHGSIELYHILSSQHLVISHLNDFITKLRSKDDWDAVSEEEILGLVDQISNSFSLESMDFQFQNVDTFLTLYHEFIPNMLTELMYGRPIAFTANYELATNIIEFISFTTLNYNMSKERISMQPYRLIYSPEELIDAYAKLGYLVFDLSTFELPQARTNLYIKQIWDEVSQEEQFSDLLYNLREKFSDIWEELDMILSGFCKGIEYEEVPKRISHPAYDEFRKYLLNRINPHIMLKALQEIEPDSFYW